MSLGPKVMRHSGANLEVTCLRGRSLQVPSLAGRAEVPMKRAPSTGFEDLLTADVTPGLTRVPEEVPLLLGAPQASRAFDWHQGVGVRGRDIRP